MTSDTEKSFKSKLRVIAKVKNLDPAELWQNLVLERFLVRLERSRHRNLFILKGAVMLSKYIDLGRETRDLDFLARGLNNELKNIQNVFEQIAQIDLNDGFLFEDIKSSELRHPHMRYTGANVSVQVHFGKVRFKMTIDIGFGDIVNPIEKSFPLITYSKGSLFESCIVLPCYPKEFIFAEKLETILHRGSFNSRMKDFHDLYSLISESSFHNLPEIIKSVFEHRGTPLSLHIEYTIEELSQLQNFWNAYLKNLRKNKVKELPSNIELLVSKLNHWLHTNVKMG